MGNRGYAPGEEQRYKMGLVKKLRKESRAVFCIETAETEKGFPDVLRILGDGRAVFIETKVSDRHGVIGFQRSQPLFYRRHGNLAITVHAWDCRSGQEVTMPAARVVSLVEDGTAVFKNGKWRIRL
jgi:hypothetical protein